MSRVHNRECLQQHVNPFSMNQRRNLSEYKCLLIDAKARPTLWINFRRWPKRIGIHAVIDNFAAPRKCLFAEDTFPDSPAYEDCPRGKGYTIKKQVPTIIGRMQMAN